MEDTPHPTTSRKPAPPVHESGNYPAAFERFLTIIRRLREPGTGCPWDLKQTFQSLCPQLIEEAYEAIDCVEAEGKTDDAHLYEELGDLLSVIALYAQIGEDTGRFTFESILHSISEKLVRRHPHVFGDTQVSGTDEVLKNWEAIKQEEKKGNKPEAQSLVGGLPKALPALMKSHRIGEKCARVGFDWPNAQAVTSKVTEELGEFLAELPGDDGTLARAREEFGDLLFSMVQLGRHLGFDSEETLNEANEKFIRRFKQLEAIAGKQSPQKTLQEHTPAEFESLWNQAKKIAT